MKKIISLVLCTVMILSLFTIIPFSASAEEADVTSVSASSGTTGDCTWALDDDGVLTISGKGNMKDYSNHCGPWGTDVSEVIIKNGVTSIGDFAFYGCTCLTSITIPASVTCIGEYAFYNCYYLSDSSGIRQLTIPDSVTSIGDFAFLGCDEIFKLIIPDSVTSIGEYAYGYTSSEGYGVLDWCNIYGYKDTAAETYAKDNYIPFYSLRYGTTGDCTWALDDDGVLTISGKGNMKDYSNHCGPWGTDVSEVIIKDGVKRIGNHSFDSCTNLINVTIPYSVTSIGEYAFGYKYNTDTSKYETISDFTIYGYKDTAAETYAIDNGFTFFRLKQGTTGDCTWALNDEGVLTILGNGKMGDYTLHNSAPWGTDITQVIIEDGVTSIGVYAFYDCTDLTSVTIGNSVESIGNYAFENCTDFTSAVIPASVTSIGGYAFGYTYDPNMVMIGRIESLVIYGYKDTEAENYATENKFNFVEILSGTTGNCTWTLIGDVLTISGNGDMDDYSSNSAPWGTDVSEVIIENGVTSIGDKAFSGCTGLEEIEIKGKSFQSIDSSAFTGVNGAKIYVPYGFNINTVAVDANNYTTYFGEKNYVLLDGNDGYYNVYWVDEKSGDTLEVDWAVTKDTMPEYNGTVEDGYLVSYSPEVLKVSDNAIYNVKFTEIVKYNIYVSGVQVTTANMDDVLNDGTVKYVPKGTGDSDYNELVLNNAEIEVEKREDNSTPECEFGIRTNKINDLKITLKGENTIKDSGTKDGITEKFGIAVYQDNVIIGGSGSLNISMSADDSYITYYGIRNVGGEISSPVNIDIPGTAVTKGIMIANSNTLTLKSVLNINTGSNSNTYAIDTTDNDNDPNFTITDDTAVFTAGSENIALSEDVNASFTDNDFVYISKNSDGRSKDKWDKTSSLSNYKYVRYQKGLFAVNTNDEITNGSVEVKNGRYALPGEEVYLTVTPAKGYQLEKLTVKNSDGTELDVEQKDTGYTFTMPESEATIDATFTGSTEEKLEGYSISLEGDIGVNFYMSLDKSVIDSGNDPYMKFIVPSGSGSEIQEVKVSDARTETANGKNYYIFKCKVAAKEMTSEIKAQIIDGDKTGEEYTYSVRKYAEYIHEHEDTYEKAVPLVKAMLNYGAYSQIWFNKNTADLANSGLKDSEKALPENISINAAEPKVEGLHPGIGFAGSSLSLKSDTSLSLYFKGGEELSFSCGDLTVETETSGDYTVARVRGIKADELSDEHVVTVESGDTSGTVSYVPTYYLKYVLENDGSSDDLKNVAKALYIFHVQAKEYFNSQA